MSLFDELKRRNVFRVGIAYAITGWLIAQIAGLAAASFFAPDWVMKMIITILLLGFPIAMVMAWAYEMTPEGLRRDAGDEAGQSANTAKLDRTITIALITALAYFAYDKFVLDPERDAALLESVAVQSKESEVAVEQPAVTAEAQSQSIAVLPFVNMSSDPEQEYFSDGLSEEILNLLSKVRGLKVTARTSSFAFKGKNEDVRYIGKTLNVSTVLEGSVRKSGEQVRITTQLIDVSSGTHLWSDTYDRTLTDIFTVQDNVASEILAALQVHVSTAPTRGRPTENPEAYALLLKAKATLSFGDPFRAETFLNKAIELDPEFAEAYELLALSFWYQSGLRAEAAKFQELMGAAAAKALSIDQNLLLAQAFFEAGKIEDYSYFKEIQAFERVVREDPGREDAAAALIFNLLWSGYFEEALSLSERVVEVNPLSAGSHYRLYMALKSTGRRSEALASLKAS